MQNATNYNPLPYESQLELRTPQQIRGVVIHCTELPDLQTAREYGQVIHYPDSGTGNCGHYYIDRDGSLEQWISIERVAHHTRGYNPVSVGIELVNTGRYPDWFSTSSQQPDEPYPDTQIVALVALLEEIHAGCPEVEWMAGHEDLDRDQIPASDNVNLLVQRKMDPGPMFPWPVVEAGLAGKLKRRVGHSR